MRAKNLTSRRRFFRNAGTAALAAPFGVAVSTADGTAASVASDGRERIAELEAVEAVRQRLRAWCADLAAGADDAVATLRRPEASVAACTARLRCVKVDASARDSVELSGDRRRAVARMPCRAELDEPLARGYPLVEMARAQGGGSVPRSETGMLETVLAYGRDGWQIERSSYVPQPTNDPSA